MKNIVLILVLFANVLLVSCATPTQKDGAYSDDQNRSRAKTHTELGAGYFNEKQFAIALEEFNEAIKIDPSYALAYNGLGMVQATLGEDSKAEASYKRAIALEPTNSESHNNYGNFLCSRNRVDESIAEFLAALQNPLYNTPQVAYANAGICSLRKKDVTNAEIYFTKALKIDPLLHQAAFNLAQIYFNHAQYEQAANVLQNAVVAYATPQVLWLAVRVERFRGNRDLEASYSLALRKKYPNSEEAKSLASGK